MVKREAHFCKFNCISSEDFIRNLNRDHNIDRNYDKEAMRVARIGQDCALEFLDHAEQEKIPVHEQKGESHRNISPPQQEWNNRGLPRVETSWNSATLSVNQGLGNCI